MSIFNLLTPTHFSALRTTHKLSCCMVGIAGLLLTSSCTSANTPAKQSTTSTTKSVKVVPTFNADSAYTYVAAQMDFGPRVPGTDAQKKAALWLNNEMKRHGASVIMQNGNVLAYNGTVLPAYNIIASFKPEARRRILLIAHWDSRPVADHDPVADKRNEPVPAANDGASGVGVLLEIARQLGLKATDNAFGVDILLTDVEDYGAPESWTGANSENTWALGTQYWCKNPHIPGYSAEYGILLDMVGGENATFYKEYFSNYFANDIVNMIWNKAQDLGFGDYFINENGGAITDDHYFINRMAGIPTIDIIHTRPNEESSFYPHWHTTDDTLDKISAKTLNAVGTTLMHILY